jgi:hypothetical protein
MRAATPDEIADHNWDLRKHEARPAQRVAVAEIVGYCEKLISSGCLPHDAEFDLRVHVGKTLAAFNMPSQVERIPIS